MNVTFSRLGNLGRLGNSMFQISAVVGYSKKWEIPFSWFIPRWKYSSAFQGPFNEIDSIPSALKEYHEPRFAYDDIPPIHDVDLVGYFQSKSYWQHCENEIHKLFTFEADLKFDAKKFIELHSNGKTPVACHIRRGDYVAEMAHYYHELTLDWYRQAMAHFDDSYHFFIMSDDIEYCRRHFADIKKNITFCGFSEEMDMCIGVNCRHNIIANSSFSWWIQELNRNPDKIVLAPTKDKWFKPVANHNVNDLYNNEKWILL